VSSECLQGIGTIQLSLRSWVAFHGWCNHRLDQIIQICSYLRFSCDSCTFEGTATNAFEFAALLMSGRSSACACYA
jgi:hypothetical protein